jgi:hypothetical protein
VIIALRYFVHDCGDDDDDDGDDGVNIVVDANIYNSECH